MITFKIEERANEYFGHTEAMDDNETLRLRKTFLDGANAQREIDIAIAWRWIENNVNEMRLNGTSAYWNDFRKAMDSKALRAREGAFLDGAKAQREIDTKKAWLWIEDNAGAMKKYGVIDGAFAYYRDGFREVMEK